MSFSKFQIGLLVIIPLLTGKLRVPEPAVLTGISLMLAFFGQRKILSEF